MQESFGLPTVASKVPAAQLLQALIRTVAYLPLEQLVHDAAPAAAYLP